MKHRINFNFNYIFYVEETLKDYSASKLLLNIYRFISFSNYCYVTVG